MFCVGGNFKDHLDSNPSAMDRGNFLRVFQGRSCLWKSQLHFFLGLLLWSVSGKPLICWTPCKNTRLAIPRFLSLWPFGTASKITDCIAWLPWNTPFPAEKHTIVLGRFGLFWVLLVFFLRRRGSVRSLWSHCWATWTLDFSEFAVVYDGFLVPQL